MEKLRTDQLELFRLDFRFSVFALQLLTTLDQLELVNWSPAIRWAMVRLGYQTFPGMAAGALEIAASELGAPRIPQLFSRDLQEIPPSLNDDLLDLFGRSEQTLSNHFIFETHGEKFDQEIGWELHPSASWGAELHAFDYGLALALNYRISGDPRYARHLRYLIADWIAANPPGLGTGWLPGPLARRVRNWILASDLARQDWERDAIFLDLVTKSLALQTTFLHSHVAPGLFAASRPFADDLLDCACALHLASRFFAGRKAADFRSAAATILRKEIESHFPLNGQYAEWRPSSQMRLAMAVTEWLLIRDGGPNQSREDENEEQQFFKDKLREVLAVLEGVLMPDGALPLFGPAPYLAGDELADLFAFAAVLLEDPTCENLAGKFGVLPYLFLGEAGRSRFESLPELPWKAASFARPQCGLYRLAGSASSAMVINGGQPSSQNDHQDGFSYELAIQGQRVIIDSGDYMPGEEIWHKVFSNVRAHNVLLIDGHGPRCGVSGTPRSTSEIWEPGDKAGGIETTMGLQLAHTGWAALGIEYQRAWFCLDEDTWVILDRLLGSGSHNVTSIVHFYPTFEVECQSARASMHNLAIARSRSLTVTAIPLGGSQPRLSVTRGDPPEFPGWYAPELGVKYASSVLRLEWEDILLPWIGGYLILSGADSDFECGGVDGGVGRVNFVLRGKEYGLSFR